MFPYAVFDDLVTEVDVKTQMLGFILFKRIEPLSAIG